MLRSDMHFECSFRAKDSNGLTAEIQRERPTLQQKHGRFPEPCQNLVCIILLLIARKVASAGA